MNREQTNQPKQTFVPPSDRPDVRLTADALTRDVRVRDLAVILGQQPAYKRGLESVEDKAPNPAFSQKCCEKRQRDLCDLISSPSPGAAGLEQLIEAEIGLVEYTSSLVQTGSTGDSHSLEKHR
ncbi:MAG TPA: hypothetical protein VFO40_16530 [Chthoniobacterales bacterium]|nr:hypothetical protein [Chthoniobacterales bacterium]